MEKAPRLGSKFLRALTTSINNKVIMAITGLGLLGFVIVHLLGNLNVFGGQESLNHYAKFLRVEPPLLWTARIILMSMFLLHIIEAVRLKLINRAARPEGYVYEDTAKASIASRTMFLTGLVILAFVIFHLAHFTFGLVQHQYYDQVDAEGNKDVYSMVIHGFQTPWIVAVYVIAMLFLGVHLSHGASSWFFSLGLRHPKYNVLIHYFGLVVSILIVLGNVLIPMAILCGLVGLPPGGAPK